MNVIYSMGAMLGVASVLAACSTSQPRPLPQKPAAHGQVRYEAVVDKHLKHYTLSSGQTTVAPAQRPDNPAPVYPASLVARKLPPVQVSALLIVDAEGRVEDVRIASEASDDPEQREFDAAVRAAAMQWRFTPLRIATWVEDAQGNSHRETAAAKPFSQRYRFQFEIRDGKPVVSAGAPPRTQGIERLSDRPTVGN
ncbi:MULTISPECIES: TonB family protein [Oleiagrimonas]|jgi:TonB family protein|uniref:TonB family protein n=1 Tax=Oleiagrimonas citrea TaxID=1665687 RepID=A0A846ZP92_9GAMM|nr:MULTISPECIES: TonB family protein [Oleiagrimonas]NKZ39856.1 TonB family protein [Oleiagrimonas citrea]